MARRSLSRRRRERGHRRVARLESLESRCLLAADPMISEFLASNRNILEDGNGESSDWIEIGNAGDTSIDLHQWYLTDDPERLTKWRFPDQPQSLLDPGEYLVVFASGDGVSDKAGKLHTSFRLSAGGEYLALVMPDGRTVASEFGSNGADYPEQFSDVSYGIGQESVTHELVVAGTSAYALIPDADSDSLIGTSWQGGDEAAFAAAGGVSEWIEGKTGLGFGTSDDLTPLVETDLQESMKGVNGSAYIRVPFIVSQSTQIASLQLSMQYDDGFVAYVNGTKAAQGNARDEVTWNSRATATHDGRDVEVFDLPASALAEGPNVLAIHGLNRTPSSSDFFVLPQLSASVQTGATTAGYMLTPTPGAPNRDARIGFVEFPQVDVERGFFDSTFDVTVSDATPGATLVYTTDGSRPTLTNGIQITAPDVDTPPASAIRVSETTTLSVAAFQEDHYPSRVNTQTYIFVDDVINQRDMDPDIVLDPAYRDSIRQDLKSIPTLSLVLDDEDFFGRNGIYSNPALEGRESERPLSVEYFDPNSDTEFHTHRTTQLFGQKNRLPGSEGFPCGGQVVDSLQAEP